MSFCYFSFFFGSQAEAQPINVQWEFCRQPYTYSRFCERDYALCIGPPYDPYYCEIVFWDDTAIPYACPTLIVTGLLYVTVDEVLDWQTATIPDGICQLTSVGNYDPVSRPDFVGSWKLEEPFCLDCPGYPNWCSQLGHQITHNVYCKFLQPLPPPDPPCTLQCGDGTYLNEQLCVCVTSCSPGDYSPKFIIDCQDKAVSFDIVGLEAVENAECEVSYRISWPVPEQEWTFWFLWYSGSPRQPLEYFTGTDDMMWEFKLNCTFLTRCGAWVSDETVLDGMEFKKRCN